MPIAANKRDLHYSSARLLVDALSTANQVAVVPTWRIGEGDRPIVGSAGLEFEQLLEELDVDR